MKNEATKELRLLNQKDADKNIVYNSIWVSGRIKGELQFSHKFNMERFYALLVECLNPKQTVEELWIIVSEMSMENLEKNAPLDGKWIEVEGYLRSFRKSENGQKLHLQHYVLLSKCSISSDSDKEFNRQTAKNTVKLFGRIGREPYSKVVASGKLKTDFILMVERKYAVSKDLIPCVTYEGSAKFARNLSEGDIVEIKGRLQTKKLYKKLDDGTRSSDPTKIYEVFVTWINVLHKSGKQDNGA